MTDTRRQSASPLGGYLMALIGALVAVYCAGFAFAAVVSGSADSRLAAVAVGLALGTGLARRGLRHTSSIDH